MGIGKPFNWMPNGLESPPPLELHIANQVAMSLLTTVVEIISAG